MSNYGNDRLALYTFESAIKFVQCWTNLRLKQVPPLEMGIKYFEMYPEEKDPVWRVGIRSLSLNFFFLWKLYSSWHVFLIENFLHLFSKLAFIFFVV